MIDLILSSPFFGLFLTCAAWELGKWVQARRLSEPECAAAEEAKALRREVERLRRENEVLLKASAFFASRQL